MKLIKNLGPYTYEGAIIYIQSLIRTSVLYAAETMCNTSEAELRAIEKIEESVLRKVFRTKQSCPRHLLYLESGTYPARHQVHRQMLNFLHYILQQPQNSILFRMFQEQQINPIRGDWASCVTELISKYDLKLTIEEIKKTKSSIFKSLVKCQVEKIAFQGLLDRQQGGQKGKLIPYERLEIADYPFSDCHITPEEKSELFSIRCEMDDYPSNFGAKTKCDMGCPELMNSEHILVCIKLNNEETNYLKYEHILKGTMNQKVAKKIKELKEKKETNTLGFS